MRGFPVPTDLGAKIELFFGIGKWIVLFDYLQFYNLHGAQA